MNPLSPWVVIVSEHWFAVTAVLGAIAFAALVYGAEMFWGGACRVSMPRLLWQPRLVLMACVALVASWAFVGNAQSVTDQTGPFVVATSGIEDAFAIYNKLSGASLATLLFLILLGNKQKVWRWGSDFIELETRKEKECKLLADDRDFWRNNSMRMMGVAEAQGDSLVVVASQVSSINQKILKQHHEP